MKKLYFKSVDDNHCQSLEDHLNEAKADGVTDTITIIEAIPDKVSGYIWCTLCGAAVEKWNCSKKACSSYEKPLKGNACAHKGQFYTYGEDVLFDVSKGKPVNPDYDAKICTFNTFNSWVNRASSWLHGYKNTQIICLDTKNRICEIGKDFQRSRDDDSFPVTVYKIYK